MEEWKEYKLDQVCENIYSGGTPATMIKEYWNGNLPWLSSGETGQRYIYSTEKTITQLGVDNSSTRYAYKNSTVVASAGQGYTRGQASFLTIDTYVNQSVIVLKPNLKLIDPKYLYFNIDNRYAELRQLSDGTSTRGSLSGKIMKDLSIKLPPLHTQQKIATILSSLDDKIELNNKINTNLEQQAQALFKNWFVDFEPFGGKMPEGWKVGKLSDIAEIKTDTFKPEQNPDIQVEHYSLPAFDEKRYPTFEISNELKSNKFIISDDEILVSKLNPTVKRVWQPYCLTEKSICSTEFIVYKPISVELKDYLFSIVNSSEFNDFMCSNVTGSTNSHQRTPPKTTLNYEIPIPTKEILHNFCNIVTPMYDKIKENIKQNETVSSLRDTLLPKLMNGEVEVGEVII